MKQLWAPWRMTYLEGDDQAGKEGCIFCIKDLPGEDRQRLVVHRGYHAFVIMNRYPYTNGHLMVAPYRHTAELGGLSPEEILDLHRLVAASRDALMKMASPDGFNLGMNLGRAAGAGVTDHLHVHVVPRWSGDTNFMPVLADLRVVPEHLETTYDRLRAVFAGSNS